MTKTIQALIVAAIMLAPACASDSNTSDAEESNLAFLASSACWEWAQEFQGELKTRLKSTGTICKKKDINSVLSASSEILTACIQATNPGIIKIVFNRSLAETMQSKGCPNIATMANAVCLARAPSASTLQVSTNFFSTVDPSRLAQELTEAVSIFLNDQNFLITYFQGLCSRAANDPKFTLNPTLTNQN